MCATASILSLCHDRYNKFHVFFLADITAGNCHATPINASLKII